ncbi:MAG: hypothetical protein ABSH41_27590 [Syntrophobacteraceae bacterium]|jgi:tetratricopeptide (TPR) repeat protein
MRRFLYLLTLVTFILPSAIAAPYSEQTQECIEQMKNENAAYAAKDWPQLERIARRVIQSCSGIDPDIVASAYQNISTACNETNRPKEALDAAVSCIEFSYAYSAGCHIEKIRALMALGRFAEAKASLEIAERLLRQLLSQTELCIRNARSSSERELCNVRKDGYQEDLKYIQLVREKLEVLDKSGKIHEPIQ